jgi:chromosome segregation ATPase
MELGIENLQRTLDSRETDIDNLEKDLYECRSIIVEQRYKIDGLESSLRDASAQANKQREEEEGIEVIARDTNFV